MDKILIRQVRQHEVEQLKKVGAQTFVEAFSVANSEENMRIYLESRFTSARIKTELSDPNSIFYFAEDENQIIGYLKVNFGEAQTDLKEENAVELERIYVFKKFHGKKVGQKLCDKAIEIAKQQKVNYIWLGVWEENPRAIRFYEKNGFIAFDKHLFLLGDEEQIDLMMKLKL